MSKTPPVLLCAVLCLLGSTTLHATIDAARLEGRPTFDEGKALGYFVWREGDTYKVRWTTFGAERRFSGRVTAVGGTIRSLKRIDVDEERRVIAPGRPARVVRGPRGRVRTVRPGRGPVVAERNEDHIVQENEHVIAFDTRTTDDIDGFDFTVGAGAEALRLALEIDGRPESDEVEVGRGNVKPREAPLVIRVR